MVLPQVVKRMRRAPRRAPCPRWGRPGRRKRLLRRRVRTLAYQRVAWLEVTYAEYQARCRCGKYFRTWPLDVPPKADYDGSVRPAVLDRLLRDRLNGEQTRAAMRRDFLVAWSDGFVYDGLRWPLGRLDLAEHRRMVREQFSGILCVDEIHLGDYTLLLASDPLADLPVGFALVSANDQAHRRRFLRNLANWGLTPQLVVTDGSSLYPELLAEVWPEAKHQLCIFHLLRDILNRVLDAVRRLRRACARRGRAGRKRRRGRPRQQPGAQQQQRGPTNRAKASFVWRHRFLIVKRSARLTRADWDDRVQLFRYLPELRSLWYFSQDLYRLLDDSQTLRVARWRYPLLQKDPEYQQVKELVEALGRLAEPKRSKAMAFVGRPRRQRVRTNNHVEGLNRRLRFAEKVRYKWRKRRWVVRWVVLLLDLCWREATPATAARPRHASRAGRSPPQGNNARKRVV
jgi:hypothetical protein